MRSVFLLFFLLGMFARADEFDDANQLFDAGKFDEAQQHYAALVERGEWSANLFYNLGNAEFRAGAPGRAMLDYERALVLDPAHAEARGNLRLLRDQTNARLPERTWLDVAFGSFSLNAWTLLAASCGWAIVFCIVVPLCTRRAMSGGSVFTMILAIFGCAYGATGVWHASQDQDAGIVVAKQVEARFEPADRAGLADTLPAGSRVRVLSERGVWTYCELPGKGRGWVPAASVERIRLAKS
jgi:tetratricopeptide (TPR) repeat protein